MRYTIAIGLLFFTGQAGVASPAGHSLSVNSVAAHGGHIYLNVAGDVDGDGVADEGVVRLRCADGVVRSSDYHLVSPRDVATGQSSGKRTHSPVTFVKEWGPSTPQFRTVAVSSNGLPKITPKIAKESHGRMAAPGWTPIVLADPGAVCAAAAEATKSRSNIQNN